MQIAVQQPNKDCQAESNALLGECSSIPCTPYYNNPGSKVSLRQ